MSTKRAAQSEEAAGLLQDGEEGAPSQAAAVATSSRSPLDEEGGVREVPDAPQTTSSVVLLMVVACALGGFVTHAALGTTGTPSTRRDTAQARLVQTPVRYGVPVDPGPAVAVHRFCYERLVDVHVVVWDSCMGKAKCSVSEPNNPEEHASGNYVPLESLAKVSVPLLCPLAFDYIPPQPGEESSWRLLDNYLEHHGPDIAKHSRFLAVFASGGFFKDYAAAKVQLHNLAHTMRTTNQVLAGHIINIPGKLPYLHEQFFMLDVRQWLVELGRVRLADPVFSKDKYTFAHYQASNTTFHDDYTPHWIGPHPEGPRYLRVRGRARFGTEILDSIINLERRVYNVPMELRVTKNFVYPNYMVSSFLQEATALAEQRVGREGVAALASFGSTEEVQRHHAGVVGAGEAWFHDAWITTPALCMEPSCVAGEVSALGTRGNAPDQRMVGALAKARAHIASHAATTTLVTSGEQEALERQLAGCSAVRRDPSGTLLFAPANSLQGIFAFLTATNARHLVWYDTGSLNLQLVRVVRELVLASQSRDDFVGRLFGRSVRAWEASTGTKLSAATQQQFFATPPDPALVASTSSLLCAPSRELYQQHLAPREGARSADALGLVAEGTRPHLNYGQLGLGSDESFLRVQRALRAASVGYVQLEDVAQLKGVAPLHTGAFAEVVLVLPPASYLDLAATAPYVAQQMVATVAGLEAAVVVSESGAEVLMQRLPTNDHRPTTACLPDRCFIPLD